MPGGDLPLKNDEYINEELENSTITAENAEKSEDVTEVTVEAETPDTEKEPEKDESSPVENEDESADTPSLFDDAAESLDESSLPEDEDSESVDEPFVPEEDSEAVFVEEPEKENSVEDDNEAIADEEVDEEDSAEEEVTQESEKDDDLPDQEKKKTPDDEEKPRRVDNLFDFIELFVFTLIAVFIITSFFFRYSIVDGGSMQNTLEDDEALILRSFLYTPECGDIVVVQDKSTALKDPIVKRIIAVGGQTVKFTRDAVYVDGVELDEPYVYTGDYENPFGGEDIYRYSVYPSDALLPIVTAREDGVFYEITVPEGEIFVMGDHRNNSKDSRDIGTIHEDAIIGKVVLRFLPFNNFGKIK